MKETKCMDCFHYAVCGLDKPEKAIECANLAVVNTVVINKNGITTLSKDGENYSSITITGETYENADKRGD